MAAGLRRLLCDYPGYGYKGDFVEVLREIGALVLVSNGVKHFCVESKNLGICTVRYSVGTIVVEP